MSLLKANTIENVAGTSSVLVEDLGTVDTSSGDLIINGINFTPIGVNQTWTNMTASRSANTPYTNNTGRPIMIVATLLGPTSSYSWIVDGVQLNDTVYFGDISAGDRSSVATIIVPNNMTYELGSAEISGSWLELR